MYRKEIKDIYKEFNSSINGLDEQSLLLNNKKYGKNKIVENTKENPLKVFLQQFNDCLVIILIAASIVSMIFKEHESAIVIFVVLLLNAILGTMQYFKAEKSIKSLKSLQISKIKVKRNNKIIEIDNQDLTLGDIVLFELGNKIPADLRIIEANDLEINESALTGESVSICKNNNVILNTVGTNEQTNMAFSGSFVTNGSGIGIVVAIGNNSIIGKIANMVKDAEKKNTPLQKNLNKLSKILAIIIILICIIVFILEVLNGMTFINSLLFSVALAVAAIPEALSSIVTITLAIGCERMVGNKAIVKNLKSVEALGSVSIICTDKTGTLTENKMKVEKIFINRAINKIDLNNETDKSFINALILCNNATLDVGNEMEKAIIKYVHNLGINYTLIRENNKIVYVEPFNSIKKMMLVKTQNKGYFKGACDYLLPFIKKISIDGIIYDLKGPHYYQIINTNKELCNEGYRVLLIGEIINNEYCFLGLVAFKDPIKENVSNAISEVNRLGCKVVMITGDYEDTAYAIGKKINICNSKDEVINGFELDKITEEELAQKINNYSIFARVNPTHKLKIVKAYQRNNEVVAMTGDGINDAPALSQADIGISMGIQGTDCAKESSSIILSDDNFSTITSSIVEGRIVYNNIKNAIIFLISGNMAGLIAVIYNTIFNFPMPFTAEELLFINLVTDSLPAIAIGMDNTKKYYKRNHNIIDYSFLFKTVIYGILIGTVTIIAFLIGYKTDIKLACTLAFSTICLARLYHGFNFLNHGSIFKYGIKNKYAIEAFLIGVILVFSVLFIEPLREFFKISLINKNHFLTINILAIIPTLILQIYKIWGRD